MKVVSIVVAVVLLDCTHFTGQVAESTSGRCSIPLKLDTLEG